MTGWLATVALGAILGTPPTPRDSLARGSRLLEEQDLDGARQALETALNEGPYTFEDTVVLLRDLGVARAFLGDSDDAAWAFERLLAVAPSETLPYTLSPKATFLFEKARQRALSVPALQVRVETPAVVRFGQPIEVTCLVAADPHRMVQTLEIHYRRKGAERFSTQPVSAPEPGRAVTVVLPPVESAADTEGVILEVGVGARSASAWEVVAAAANLREIPVGFDAPGPWYSRWWFWTSVGATVVAASSVAIWAATRPLPDDTPFSYNVNR